MAEHIGSVYVEVLPDADGFINRLRSQIVAPAAQLGDEAARAFMQQFTRGINLEEVFRRTRPDTTRQAGQSGKDAGDAFGREVDARIAAALKALPDIKLDADSSEAQRKVAALRSELSALTYKAELGISDREALANIEGVRRELESLQHDGDIRIRVNSGAALAELGALQAELARLDGSAVDTGAALGGVGDTAESSLRPVLDTVLTLSPALVPLAGGLLGLSTSILGIGVDGVLAFRGINNEIKNGTELGGRFASGLGVMKGELAQLQHTAAAGVLQPFNNVVDRLTQKLPELNAFISHTSPVVGDLLDHTLGGFLNLLTGAEPLITTAISEVDRLATRFEAWSQGPGGAQFFDALESQIPIAVHSIGELATALGHVLAAAEPIGEEILPVIDGISTGLAHIPVPVLTAAVAGLVAWKANALITAASNKLLTASTGEAAVAGNTLAASEARAAESTAAAGAAARGTAGAMGGLAASQGAASATGSGRLLGFLGAGLSRLAWPALIGFALNRASVGTSGWMTSDNELKQIASTITLPFRALPWHYGDIVGNADRQIAAHQDLQNMFSPTAESRQSIQQQIAAIQAGGTLGGDPNDPTTADRMAATLARLQTRYQEIQQPLQEYVTKTSQANAAARQLTFQQIDASGSLGRAGEIFGSYQDQLQKNIDHEKEWTDVKKGENTILVEGVKFSDSAVRRALQQAGGDQVKATAILLGHVEALKLNQQALADSVASQQRLDGALADAQARYGVSTEQATLYSAALGLTSDQMANNRQVNVNLADALGEVKHQLNDGNAAVQGWMAAAEKWQQSAQTSADKADLLGAALRAAMGVQLDMATANLSAVSATENVATVLDKYRGSVSSTGELLGQMTKTAHGWVIMQPKLTEGGLAIAQALQQQASSAIQAAQMTYQNELATRGSTIAASDALGIYTGYRDQLISTAEQMGYSSQAAQGLADKYLAIPSDVDTFVKQFGAGDVTGAIGGLTQAIAGLDKDIRIQLGLLDPNAPNRIQEQIDAIHGTKVFVEVDWSGATVGRITYGPDGRTEARADGGFLRGPGTGRSDSMFIRASNGEYIVNAAATAKHRALLDAINYGAPGFADGGFVPPSLLIPSQTTAGKAAAAQANQAVKALESYLPQFAKALGGTTSALVNAGETLIQRLDGAQNAQAISSTLVSKLDAENKQLDKLATARDALAEQIKTANSKLADAQRQFAAEQSKISDLFTGGLDLTTLTGTPGYDPSIGDMFYQQMGITNPISGADQMIAAARQKAAQATTFGDQLARLRKAGLNDKALQQLAEAGFDKAEPAIQQLLTAGPAKIKDLNAAMAALQTNADRVGTFVAKSLYGAGVAAADGLIAGLKSRESAIEKQMQALGAKIVASIKGALQIKSPSQVMRALGVQTADGFALGLADGEQLVRARSGSLATAALPRVTARPVVSAQNGGGNGGLERLLAESIKELRQIRGQVAQVGTDVGGALGGTSAGAVNYARGARWAH